MKLSNAVVSGLCAWGLSLPALAQAPATSISIGELPALGGDRVNRLATVTITENHPAAIRDGMFTLYFPDNPDQTVEFQAGSSVSGPATARPATNFLIIQVDTDDSVTETIVIQPEAFFRTRLPIAPGFALMDGDPMRAGRTGVLDGVTMDRFELGTLGDIIGLEIGFEEDVTVGQTIVQDIRTAEGENTGPYTAETLDPAVASAIIDGATVRITGLSPGTTHALVHDSLGRQDMMVVNVLPAPGGDLTGTPGGTEPEPEPEPELNAPFPVTPEPEQQASIIPAAPQEPAPEPAETPAPTPQPAAESGALAGDGPSGGGVAVFPAPTPEPAASGSDTPATAEGTDSSGVDIAGTQESSGSSGTDTAGAQEGTSSSGADTAATPTGTGSPVSSAAATPQSSGSAGTGAAPALELPRLAEAAVMGGGSSTAVISAGASADGETFRGSFGSGERVSIAGEILPEVAQINAPGELFVAVRVTTATGAQAWFHQNGGNWSRWNGSVSALQPVRSGALAATERLEIFDGPLRPGRYEVYLGYAADGDALIYSAEPLVVEVSE